MGPRKRNVPIGLSGSFSPALLRKIALVTLSIASLCPIISFCYTFLWVVSFLKAPFYKTIAIPFEPFAQFVNIIHPININYEGELINMSYIVCSGLFIIFHYIFDFFALRIVDLYNLEEDRLERKRNIVRLKS